MSFATHTSPYQAPPPALAAQAELELRRRYAPARGSLEGFVRATKKNMLWGWFVQRLCGALDKFLADVVAGKHPRLMIIAPPRHGKSEAASRRFPAYVFGHHPAFHIISCTYAADLAHRLNRDVQRIIDQVEYRRTFPGTRLNVRNIATLSGQPLRNSSIFELIPALGSYRGAGVGQGITGMGFDVGIIDDPVKDAAQAASEAERDNTWEWYETTFYSRASPLSGMLLIMTRWNEDDLAGRLLHKAEFEGGDQWEVVRFPALAEHDEYDAAGALLRREGEALDPVRYSKERLEAIRTVIGSYAFAALYQGRPTPKGGGIITREDFRFYRREEVEGLKFDLVALSVDAAFKDADTSSYVVIQAWGRVGIRHYLLAQKRARLTFTRTMEAILAMRSAIQTRGYAVNASLIEDKANGTAIIDVLTTRVPGIIAVEPHGSKVARAEAVAPLIEAGNVWVPDPQQEPWVEAFLHEWLAVPTGAFWDQVDACAQYLLRFGVVQLPVNLEGAAAVTGGVAEEAADTPWTM